MKRITPFTIVSLTLITNTALAQGVPVYDNASVIDRGVKHLETIQQWGKQYGQMQEQATKLQTQIQNFKTNAIGSLLGSLQTTGQDVAEKQYGDYASGFASDANRYFGDKANQCQQSGSGNNPNYQACIAQRNMKAATLKEMHTLLKKIDARGKEIDALLKKASAGEKKPGEMQGFQFQISTIQAQIQNDLAKMQLSLAIYKQKEEIFKQQARDSAKSLMSGGKEAVSLKDVLGKLKR